MKKLSLKQIEKLKTYWEEEVLYLTKQSESIVKVFFDADAMDYIGRGRKY